MSDTNEHLFIERFRGNFYGVLQWEQLEVFWGILRGDTSGWYIYALGESPPVTPSTPEQVMTFIDNVDELLRREHEEDYCGIVYADDPEAPTFVKIFDPNNLGVSCGYSDNPPLPGWILSKLRPTDLKSPFPAPGNRRRWWRQLFG